MVVESSMKDSIETVHDWEPCSRPRRVLVIEDNLDAAETLRLVLEWFGHQVVTAHSGRTGLEQARKCKPEVVFCDIGLPDTDGYAVARALRSLPDYQPACLVAMTPGTTGRRMSAGPGKRVSTATSPSPRTRRNWRVCLNTFRRRQPGGSFQTAPAILAAPSRNRSVGASRLRTR